MNRLTCLSASLAMLSTLAARGDIITVRTLVDDAGHVLDGATLSQSFDVSTWIQTSNPFRVTAGGTTSTSTISGATGVGAVWNGSYTALNTGIRLGFLLNNGSSLITSAVSFVSGASTSIVYSDGTKTYAMRVYIDLGPDAINVGSPVVEGNFGIVRSSAGIRSFSAGPAFTDPNLNGGSVTFASAAVPEPSSLAILGLGGVAFVGYRRRKLKQVA